MRGVLGKVAHASRQPTNSAGNVKPQVSRIKEIEDQMEKMLKTAAQGFYPEKKTTGGCG